MSKTGTYFDPILLGFVSTLTGDSGGAVSGAAGNIKLEGGTNITTVGVPGANKVTFNLDPTITLTRVNATTFDTNVVAAGVTLSGTSLIADGTDPNINIILTPQGSGEVQTNALYASSYVTADAFNTFDAAAGLQITDNDILADGTDLAISINITPKGAGVLATTELTLTTDLAVEHGGTGTGTHTIHGVLLGQTTAAITATAAGSNGQCLLGSTTADPAFATLGSTLGTIQYTLGVASLALDCQVAQSFTGFDSWGGAGPYYDDTALGDFEVSQSGVGYIKGKKVLWAAPQTIDGMTAGNTYWIYIDNAGTIGKTTTYNEALFRDNIVLFECMRDSTAGTNLQVTVKENHPYTVPWDTSIYLHDVVGTVIADGGANIIIDGTQKIAISGAAELEDHGLETDIADSGGAGVVWHRYFTLGSGKWAQQNETDTFTGYYNNAGTATALGAGKYGVYRLYVSKDDLNTATPTYFAVLHTAQFNNLTLAQTAISNGTIAAVSAELASLEMAQLGFIIYAQSTATIVDIIIEKATLGATVTTSGTNQASLVLTDVTNFNNLLSAANTTVQSALDTIDDLSGISSITMADTGVFQTTTVDTDIMSIQAYDVDGAAYVDFITLTNANDPTCDLNTLVTIGTNYIYRAGGTDIPVTDGGTGVSTLSDGGVMLGSGTNAVTVLAPGAAGTILQAAGGVADPAWTTASYPATTPIGTILYASAADVLNTLAPDTAGFVLTDGGFGVAPSWAAPATAGTVTSVTGGDNITASGTAAAPVMDLDATITLTTVNATTFDTNVVAAGVTLAGTSLIADGNNADISINITAKGTGQVIIDDLQLTTDLTVPYGGTGASTFTDGGLLVGATAGPIEALAAGGVGTILTGVAGANPTWTTATYPATVAIGDVLVASAADVIGVVSGAALATWVLTANGVGSAPTFQAPSGAGVASVTAGTNLTNSGTAADPTIDLDAAITGITSITMADTGVLRTTVVDTDVMSIQAYDVDGATYVDFMTLTNANDPTCDLNTLVTLGTKYIYRADGTDVPVADGGTGASTFTDGGLLVGAAAGAIEALGVGGVGTILTGVAGANPTWTTATYPATAAIGTILVASGANAITTLAPNTPGFVLTDGGAGAAPTWAAPSVSALTLNDQTGTTYEFVAADAGKMVTFSNAAAITVTVPVNADVAIAVGSQILCYQGGVGIVTFAPEGGVTINSPNALLDLYTRYSTALLTKISTDAWSLSGDLN